MNRLRLIAKQLKYPGAPSLVQVSHQNVEELFINRPEKLNTITVYLMKHFLDIMNDWKSNTELKYIILKKKEGKAFCAGGDISLFLQHQILCGYLLNDIIYKLYTMRIPQVISIWDGIIMGGGAGIGQFTHIKIATENTVYAMPEVKLGFFTDAAAGYFLSRLRNGIGKFMAMTGSSIKGKDVYNIGLADFYVNSKDLPELEKAVFEAVKNNKDISSDEMKKVVRKFHSETNTKFALEEFIAKYFTKNSALEIVKSLEENSNGDNLEKKYASLIREMCPMSVALNFEIQKIAKNMSLEDYLEMELNLEEKCFKRSDSFYGLKNFLEKKKTIWMPAKLEDVDEKEISYLTKVENSYKFDKF